MSRIAFLKEQDLSEWLTDMRLTISVRKNSKDPSGWYIAEFLESPHGAPPAFMAPHARDALSGFIARLHGSRISSHLPAVLTPIFTGVDEAIAAFLATPSQKKES